MYVFPLKFNLLTVVSWFPMTRSLSMFLVSHPFYSSLSITAFLQYIVEVLAGFPSGRQSSLPGTVFLPASSFFTCLGKLHFPGLAMTVVNASALSQKSLE